MNDDKAFYPVYERASELAMPGLFHLGVVARHEGLEARFINSDFMRPIHLDAIARVFPDWTMIGAHFGNPWHKEAGMGHYPPGSYRKVLDFKEKAKDLKGVSFVSDIFGGCFMEAAMVSANEAVKRVCGWGGTA